MEDEAVRVLRNITPRPGLEPARARGSRAGCRRASAPAGEKPKRLVRLGVWVLLATCCTFVWLTKVRWGKESRWLRACPCLL